MALEIKNTAGSALDGFTLAFNGEQWRNGGNTSAQKMVFEYGFGSTFAGVSTWLAPGGLFDWTSPVASGTGAAVDGNAAGRVSGRGGSLSLSWANDATLWLRWTEPAVYGGRCAHAGAGPASTWSAAGRRGGAAALVAAPAVGWGGRGLSERPAPCRPDIRRPTPAAMCLCGRSAPRL